MNNQHLQKLSEADVIKGLKPVVNHEFFAYFEEYIRREQLKQVRVLSTASDLDVLHRAQGNFQRLQALADLKTNLNLN